MPHKPTESIILKESNAEKHIMIALAHPDDESFGTPPVGTILHYAANGVAVHYACATRGEVGAADPEFVKDYASTAEMRTAEMRCAAEVLGLTSLHFLNYRDSGMENSPDNDHPDSLVQAPVEDVAEKVVALIRQIKPQILLAFDPTGGYFHPDHIHMHKAATLAFHAAADAAQFPAQIEAGLIPHQVDKLYYLAFSRGFVRMMARVAPLFGKDPSALGRNKDINIKRIAEVEQTITTKIDVSHYFNQAQQAAGCHASQLGGLPNLPKFIQKQLGRKEMFTRIVPPFAENQSIETDLFVGL